MIQTDAKLDTQEDLLGAVLRGTVEALDIPDAQADQVLTRYLAVGGHLNQHGDAAGGAAWDVYPQGSFRLGTVVRPGDEGGDVDIDLVLVRDIHASSTTREELKGEAGVALDGYMRAAGDGRRMAEGGRCWTLYFDGYHLDVLPSVPDEEGGPTAILLADKHSPIWLHSDPKGYAEWFRQRQHGEWLAKAA